jgi:hypothetical protein
LLVCEQRIAGNRAFSAGIVELSTARKLLSSYSEGNTMKSLLSITALLLAISLQTHAAAVKITAYCPEFTELKRTTLSNSWAKYEYTGQSPINLASINNLLYFKGDTNAESANYFSGATWTDSTFLCLYNYDDEAIVMYESQLAPFVERCYFAHPGSSECTSSNPQACPITCELTNEK